MAWIQWDCLVGAATVHGGSRLWCKKLEQLVWLAQQASLWLGKMGQDGEERECWWWGGRRGWRIFKRPFCAHTSHGDSVGKQLAWLLRSSRRKISPMRLKPQLPQTRMIQPLKLRYPAWLTYLTWSFCLFLIFTCFRIQYSIVQYCIFFSTGRCHVL